MAISIRNAKRVAKLKFSFNKELQGAFLKQHILKVKDAYLNNKDRAKALSISERTLYRYYSQFSIPYERQGWEQIMLKRNTPIEVDLTRDLPVDHYLVKVGRMVRINGTNYKAIFRKSASGSCIKCDLNGHMCQCIDCYHKIFKRVE